MKNIVEIKKSKFGKGLFAKSEITKGTVICPIPIKDEFDFSFTTYLHNKESHALQIDLNKYVFCEPPFLYSNHSCNPNAGINPNFEMIALNNIQRGQEIFWDYATSMLERHWTMTCKCGEKNCRQIVTDFDLMPHDIQSKYLELNITLPFIVQYLQQKLGRTG